VFITLNYSEFFYGIIVDEVYYGKVRKKV